MIVKLPRAATCLAILFAAGALTMTCAAATEVAHSVHAADPACVSRIVQLPLHWRDTSARRFDWCRASAYGAGVSEQATRRAVMQACC